MLHRSLAHYQILEKLGQGGMGEVYLAQDQKLGRQVALKVLPEKLAADAERLKRFEREARAIAALKHPNIVTLYSIEEAEGIHFLTMEHVEGDTIAGEVVEGGMPLERFFDLAIPLADALSTAHGKGIAHRDIKPANIMRDGEGRLKVLDFGLAKLFETGLESDETLAAAPDSITSDGRIVGTVAYMSPEQAEGRAVDARSDVFSLGIVLYELATGTRPFQGQNNISTLSSILKDEPTSVSELRPIAPRHLGRIIARCLTKDPDRRYQSALDVRNELENLRTETDSQDELTISQTGMASAPVGESPKRSRRSLPTAVVAAVTAVLALVVFRAIGPQDETPVATVPTPPSTAEAGRRVVVFPFENLGSTDDAYFAAGITEEITSRLARIDELSVMSRTSAVQYDRTGKTMQQIHAELGVDYVLEGSVRWDKRSGTASRVRVTPQLIRASDDTNVWADNYDRSMDEIFAVQAEIAEQVVAKLNVTLLPAEQEELEERLTENIDAWHAFQRGRVTTATGNLDTRETWDLAVEMFERAIDLDPRFLRAHAELAISHAAFNHWQLDTSEERLALCKAAVDRTFEIDPESPWSFMALGYYHYHGRKDYEPAWRAFQQAQSKLGDNHEVYVALASVRRRQGRFHDALDYFEKAVDVSPGDIYGYFNTGETAGWVLGDFEYGIDQFDRAISLAPDLWVAYFYKAMNQLYQGDAEAARTGIAACPTPPLTNNEWAANVTVSLCLRDFDRALESARALTDELVDEQFQLFSRSNFEGMVYRYQGQAEAAQGAFQRARVALEERVRAMPQDARSRSALGIAYAGLGRAEDAIREGRYAVEIYPTSVDAYIAPYRVSDLVTIHLLLEQNDQALDLMEQLVGVPPHSVMPPGWLRLHPRFDGLRDQPRFQELLGRS